VAAHAYGPDGGAVDDAAEDGHAVRQAVGPALKTVLVRQVGRRHAVLGERAAPGTQAQRRALGADVSGQVRTGGVDRPRHELDVAGPADASADGDLARRRGDAMREAREIEALVVPAPAGVEVR